MCKDQTSISAWLTVGSNTETMSNYFIDYIAHPTVPWLDNNIPSYLKVEQIIVLKNLYFVRIYQNGHVIVWDGSTATNLKYRTHIGRPYHLSNTPVLKQKLLCTTVCDQNIFHLERNIKDEHKNPFLSNFTYFLSLL